MMRICLFWVLLLFVSAQTGYAQEMKEGFYPDGKIRYRGYFQNGKPVGEMTRYYPNGRIKALMNHKGDTTEVVLYSKEGEYTSKGRYIARKKDGVWEYRKGDFLLATEQYKNNILAGEAIRYFPSGKKAEDKIWKAGLPDGEWKMYYENGRVRMQAFFVAGKLNGEVKSFGDDGELRTAGKYHNDLKEGKWAYYDPDGKLLKELYYIGGVPENAEELELEESRNLDVLIDLGKKIPDPAEFSDDPEGYMKVTGIDPENIKEH